MKEELYTLHVKLIEILLLFLNLQQTSDIIFKYYQMHVLTDRLQTEVYYFF